MADSRAPGGPRTVLVGMPWESAARPSLALGTLAAIAARAGFECVVVPLNLDCAATVGAAVYDAFAENVELFPLGEHLFAVDLFGTERLDSEAYLHRFGGTAPDAADGPDALHNLRDRIVPDFLGRAAAAVLQHRPDVVGLTCTFNQVLPSLALARRLKQAQPGVTVLLGGASVHGRMGEAYLTAFGDIVDHVFTGEADDSFVEWLRAYRDGEPHRPIRGIAGPVSSMPAVLTHRLDELPVPDFKPFFAHRERLLADGAVLGDVHHVPYESSRGCWWGEKHHCTFCGLNNEGMTYRRKSPQRVVAEMEQLAADHGLVSLMAADNILDFRGYRDLLDQLAASPVDWDLFYEIKANVRRSDVAALRRAGVWRVQPGIESFSDAVLKLMHKGVTGLANVQLLKWAREHGIRLDYNVLVGFPGETAADYETQLRLIRAIPHLQPPNGKSIVVRVDRFSPFFDQPVELGIRGVRPADYYRHLIPPEVLAAEHYAYFFDRDLDEVHCFDRQIAELDAAIEQWQGSDVHRRARLLPGAVDVQSWTTSDSHRQALRDVDAAVFVLADAVTTREALARRLHGVADGAAVQASVLALAEAGLMVTDGERVLATVPFAVAHTDAELRAWAARALGETPAAEPGLDAAPLASGRASLPLLAAEAR